MSIAERPQRVLFAHAHPDDETLATGVAMAVHVRAGDEVHLLTCTLGDEGEVIPPELRHLAADADDALGPYRRGELRRAMSHLDVHEHVLGEDEGTERGAAFRDSGMAGAPSAAHPRALLGADPDEVRDAVLARLRHVDPDIVVTYDRHGGYGHPDHIRTHEAVCAAIAALPEGERPALYAAYTPRSWAEEDRDWVRRHVEEGDPVTLPETGDPYPPSVVDDDVVTHEVHGDAEALALRDLALREHRTQVTVYRGYYALSNHIAARLPAREGYARLDPTTGTPLPGSGERVPGLHPRRDRP